MVQSNVTTCHFKPSAVLRIGYNAVGLCQGGVTLFVAAT